MLIYQGLGMIFGLLIAYITGKIDGKTLKLLSIIVLYILFGIIACNILYETMVSAATFQYKIEEQSGVATLAYEQFVHSKIIKWNVGVYTSQLVGLIIGYFRIKRNKKHENLKIRKEEKNIPDDVYRQIAEELQANKRDSMLMVKAIAQSKGDKALAESLYIQLRAEYIVSTLQNEEKKKQRETETLHRESESVVQTKKAQAWSKGEELEGIQKAKEQARQDKNEEGIDGLGRFWLIFFVIIFLIAIIVIKTIIIIIIIIIIIN